MKKFPYGIADFLTIRSENYLYVDRTSYIRKLEAMGPRHLLFVRPRRFGKSLWLNVLKCYYDIALKDEFDTLFGDLDIGKNPTPLRNGYFVLDWNFSRIDPRGGADDIADGMNETLNNMTEEFLTYYKGFINAPASLKPQAVDSLGSVLGAVAETGNKLYLLIDEYDNFANEVMTSDEETYRDLVRKEGQLKTLFKGLKALSEGRVLDRIFVTGVSPVVMSDVTSGANIFTNIFLDDDFNALCGFTKKEVREISMPVLQACGKEALAEDVMQMLRTWYDGFLFSEESRERVYNPTLVLYFLEHFSRKHAFPKQILDANLAADEGKLEFIGKITTGRQTVIDALQTDEPLVIEGVSDRFTLASMLDRIAQDDRFLGSYLYYFGMLTISGTDIAGRVLLEPPNLVMKKLYADRILRFLLPLGTDRNEAAAAVNPLLLDGDLQPLITFVERKIFPTFSNRDYRWMNEFAVKTAFTVLLFNDITYALFSEPELSRGHADLCLIIRPDARKYEGLRDMLFEFKYVSPKKLGMTGKEVREMPEKELLKKTPVKKAFTDARSQLKRYETALRERFGDPLRLRAWSVVSVGFERLLETGLTSEKN